MTFHNIIAGLFLASFGIFALCSVMIDYIRADKAAHAVFALILGAGFLYSATVAAGWL